MFEPQPIQSTTEKWALGVSLALHAAVVAASALFFVPDELPAGSALPVNVEVISNSAFEALSAPDAAAVSAVPNDQPAPQATASGDDEFVAAQSFLASSVLAAPENAEVRRNLPRLASSEQIIQLCNIEGLEQLRLGGVNPAPDVLVGYAYGDIETSGFSLTADGGAYRSGGRWFHIRYRCGVSNDIASVTSFEYALGAIIPETEWQAHNLNADDDWLN